MILSAGRVTAKPDTLDEILCVSREEPGCISHDVSIDADDPLTLHFVERWVDAGALKAHFRVKESRAMWKTLQYLAADPGAMHIYEACEIKL